MKIEKITDEYSKERIKKNDMKKMMKENMKKILECFVDTINKRFLCFPVEATNNNG